MASRFSSPDDEKYMPRNADITSPIYHLPTEILAAIFETGVANAMAGPESRFELVLSHVSQHWRNIAFPTRTAYQQDYSQCIHPEVRRPDLDLRFEIGNVLGGFHRTRQDPDDIESFSSIFFTYSSRWRRISVFSDSQSFYNRILSWTSRVSLPTLRAASFETEGRCFDEESIDRPALLLQPFHDAPRLTAFRTDLVLPPRWLPPPLKSITHLDLNRHASLHDEYHPMVSSTLSSMPLQWLKIGERFDPARLSRWPPPISINTLEQILDLNCRAVQTGSLITAINAPKLHTLTITTSFLDNSVLPGRSMGNRSFASLRKLSLRMDSTWRHQLHRSAEIANILYKAFPFIVDLSFIEFSEFENLNIACMLLPDAAEPMIWPCLRILHLQHSKVNEPYDIQAIVHSLAARKEGATLRISL